MQFYLFTENDHEEISEEVEDALAIKLEETVHSLEAKCAGVREELGRMALSEQYMRTKQAQLKAKKKEKEAEEAAKRAAQKELEAAVIAKSDVIVSGLLSPLPDFIYFFGSGFRIFRICFKDGEKENCFPIFFHSF